MRLDSKCEGVRVKSSKNIFFKFLSTNKEKNIWSIRKKRVFFAKFVICLQHQIILITIVSGSNLKPGLSIKRDNVPSAARERGVPVVTPSGIITHSSSAI